MDLRARAGDINSAHRDGRAAQRPPGGITGRFLSQPHRFARYQYKRLERVHASTLAQASTAIQGGVGMLFIDGRGYTVVESQRLDFGERGFDLAADSTGRSSINIQSERRHAIVLDDRIYLQAVHDKVAHPTTEERRVRKQRAIKRQGTNNTMRRFLLAIFFCLDSVAPLTRQDAHLFSPRETPRQRKIVAQAKTDLGYQAPLWVAHKLKLIADKEDPLGTHPHGEIPECGGASVRRNTNCSERRRFGGAGGFSRTSLSSRPRPTGRRSALILPPKTVNPPRISAERR